jgi:hypothetical protein
VIFHPRKSKTVIRIEDPASRVWFTIALQISRLIAEKNLLAAIPAELINLERSVARARVPSFPFVILYVRKRTPQVEKGLQRRECARVRSGADFCRA